MGWELGRELPFPHACCFCLFGGGGGGRDRGLPCLHLGGVGGCTRRGWWGYFRQGLCSALLLPAACHCRVMETTFSPFLHSSLHFLSATIARWKHNFFFRPGRHFRWWAVSHALVWVTPNTLPLPPCETGTPLPYCALGFLLPWEQAPGQEPCCPVEQQTWLPDCPTPYPTLPHAQLALTACPL